MPTLRPKRSRTVIFALAAVCVAAALSGGAAMQQMRQNDLDEQLFTAIQHGSTSELAPLLEQGADPNYIPLYMGINPLKHAVGMGQSEALRLLLEYGANPDARTTSGDTARTYAKRFNRPAIDALLNAKTAKTK